MTSNGNSPNPRELAIREAKKQQRLKIMDRTLQMLEKTMSSHPETFQLDYYIQLKQAVVTGINDHKQALQGLDVRQVDFNRNMNIISDSANNIRLQVLYEIAKLPDRNIDSLLINCLYTKDAMFIGYKVIDVHFNHIDINIFETIWMKLLQQSVYQTKPQLMIKDREKLDQLFIYWKSKFTSN